MKKLVAIVFLLAVFALPASAEWYGGGRVTNPVADQVVSDSGPLPANCRVFVAIGAATVAAVFEVQHRNATNTANITGHTQILAVPASGTNSLPDFPFSSAFCMADNERVRIVMVSGVTGAVSASLYLTSP